MSDTLASLFAFGDRMKRNVRGLLSDPLSQIQRNVNSWAGGMNDAMQAPATNYIRAGGVMADDPSTQAAALAEANRMTGALLGAMPGGTIGATVWHGSPHKFAKFDASKIGTGEGAQAYGHGLYLAETPDVAKKYSDIRAGEYLGGSLYKGDEVTRYAQKSLLDNFNDPKKAAAQARIFARSAVTDEARDAWSKAAGLLDGLPVADSGNLYKVDLPDPMIARMLDWDKPLSQQAPEVQKALAKRRPDLYAPMADDYDAAELGQMIYRRLHEDAIRAGRALPAAEKERQMVDSLRKSGIPGIRYLDGGSRGAGSGTSNFVVFPGEEGALRILERNGVSLADMMGQSGKIDGRLLAALGIGSAGAWAGNALLNSGKQKIEDARKTRQQAIEQAEGK